jgi:hypothetical protein
MCKGIWTASYEKVTVTSLERNCTCVSLYWGEWRVYHTNPCHPYINIPILICPESTTYFWRTYHTHCRSHTLLAAEHSPLRPTFPSYVVAATFVSALMSVLAMPGMATGGKGLDSPSVGRLAKSCNTNTAYQPSLATWTWPVGGAVYISHSSTSHSPLGLLHHLRPSSTTTEQCCHCWHLYWTYGAQGKEQIHQHHGLP